MPMQGTKSSHCLHIPAAVDTVLMATPSEKPWQSLPWHAPTEKKRFVGAVTTTGIPCILETCVGLLAALGDPPSACLRVANKPIRTSARDITQALSTKLSCITGAKLQYVDRSLLACNRCRRNISGHTIYMYSDMGFCSNDCRCDYYVDEVEECKKRLAMALMEQISKMPRVVTRMAAIRANRQLAEGGHRPTFFTCAKSGVINSPKLVLSSSHLS